MFLKLWVFRKLPYTIDYYMVGGLKKSNSGEVKRKRGRPALVSSEHVQCELLNNCHLSLQNNVDRTEVPSKRLPNYVRNFCSFYFLISNRVPCQHIVKYVIGHLYKVIITLLNCYRKMMKMVNLMIQLLLLLLMDQAHFVVSEEKKKKYQQILLMIQSLIYQLRH